MKHIKWEVWAALIVSVLFLWSCGGGSSGSSSFTSGSTGSGNTGTLSLSLVDKPGGSYTDVYVTIKEVQVCYAAGPCNDPYNDDCHCRWETVAEVHRTFNLTELVNGVMVGLGQKDLKTGTYNQMRLLLGDFDDPDYDPEGMNHPFAQYVIDQEGFAHAMKVPSGYQTGIKLVHPFDIVKGLTTELILDFDVARSVIKAGNSGKYLLKPTIKVIGTHNRAIVSGIVSREDNSGDDPVNVPIEGAQVSAWYQDAEDNWVLAMNTSTDADGGYMLYLDLGGPYELDPKAYKIVATAEGFEPDCTELTVAVDMIYPNVDFVLLPTDIVPVTGTIIGRAPSADGTTYPETAPVVEISFSRQLGECFMEPVETAFVQVTDDEDTTTEDIFYDSETGNFQYNYSIDLPAGLYDVAASSDGLPTQEEMDFPVSAPDAVLDFDFTVNSTD